MQPDIETLPEVREITGEISQLEAYAASYRVATAEQYQAGAEDLKRVKTAQKRLEATRTSLAGPINESLRKLNAFFKGPADKLVTIERAIKRALAKFADEQERIRREEQCKANEAARKERERLEAQAREAERKAREKAAADRAAAEAAAAAGRAEEAAKLAARAAATEAKAADRVESLEVRAATVVAPVIERETPRIAGVATRVAWKCEVVDASQINPAFMMPDEKKIRRQVAALHGDAAAVIGPGVRIWSERQLAAGAA